MIPSLKISTQYDLKALESCHDFGRLIYFPSLNSTNDFARELIQRCELESDHLPALVLTDQQMAGRGQLGRTWFSSLGDISATLVVDDTFDARSRPLLPLIVGTAVCEAIESVCGLRPGLKWPNDVLLNRSKLGGILIEAFPEPGRLVIGFGVNVNSDADERNELMSQASVPAGSLRQYLGHPVDLTTLLLEIVRTLRAILDDLQVHPTGLLPRTHRLLCTINREVTVELPGGERLQGRCLGIDERGRLLVDSEGHQTEVMSGRILQF